MDWQLAITRNRDALLTIIVALMKSLGLISGGMLTTLPKCLFIKAMRILRPAESALRRLIFIAAQELSARGFTPRKPCAAYPNFDQFNPSAVERACAFNLIDPLKTFDQDCADDSIIGEQTFSENALTDRTPIPAAALGRRLLALKFALENILPQAKRLARWNARRDLALKQNRHHRLSPMRPGLPLGYKKRRSSEVETILRECHGLAIDRRAAVNST